MVIVAPCVLDGSIAPVDRKGVLRCALKQHLAGLLSDGRSPISIGHGLNGRPHLPGRLARRLGIRDISITYGAYGYAIAISTIGSVGVDMQRLTLRQAANFRHFHSRCGLKSDYPDEACARQWSRMEALAKCGAQALDAGLERLFRAASRPSTKFWITSLRISTTDEWLSVAHPRPTPINVVGLDARGMPVEEIWRIRPTSTYPTEFGDDEQIPLPISKCLFQDSFAN